jgi:hypothetical protein
MQWDYCTFQQNRVPTRFCFTENRLIPGRAVPAQKIDFKKMCTVDTADQPCADRVCMTHINTWPTLGLAACYGTP